MNTFNHQNIIKFKDVFKDRKSYINMVTEYADNGTLDEHLFRRL